MKTIMTTICVLKLIFKVFQSVLPLVGRLVGMVEIEDHKEFCLQNGFLVTVGRIFDRKRNSIRPTGSISELYIEKNVNLIQVPVKVSVTCNTHKNNVRRHLMKFCILNAQSLRNKSADFIDYICDKKENCYF